MEAVCKQLKKINEAHVVQAEVFGQAARNSLEIRKKLEKAKDDAISDRHHSNEIFVRRYTRVRKELRDANDLLGTSTASAATAADKKRVKKQKDKITKKNKKLKNQEFLLDTQQQLASIVK